MFLTIVWYLCDTEANLLCDIATGLVCLHLLTSLLTIDVETTVGQDLNTCFEIR